MTYQSCVQDKDPSLGMLGPTFRAKVGDTIRVTLKNNAQFTTSLHPHGVLYSKAAEGSPYNDGTTGKHMLPLWNEHANCDCVMLQG